MKVIKVTLISVLSIVAVLIIAMMIWLFVGAAEESTSDFSKEVNIGIPNAETESERITAIKTECAKYCSSKALKKIEYTYRGYENILAKNGDIVYGFEEYIDESKEGGNVSVANIYYNTNTETLYKIDFFDGAGKAYSIGGDNLDVEAWTLSVNDIADMFTERYTADELSKVPEACLEITVKNDIAYCSLSSERQSGSIAEMTFDLKQ